MCGVQESLAAKPGPTEPRHPGSVLKNYNEGLDDSIVLNTTLGTRHLWFGNVCLEE